MFRSVGSFLIDNKRRSLLTLYHLNLNIRVTRHYHRRRLYTSIRYIRCTNVGCVELRGRPAGEVAHALILKSLIGQDLGFEELVIRLDGQLSRGTVNKYLNDLYSSTREFKGFVKRRGRRGRYYVPEAKRDKVELFLRREEEKRRYDVLIAVAPKEVLDELMELRRKYRELTDAFDRKWERVLRET